jgi:succinoglycan biosynthesis protein ExoO
MNPAAEDSVSVVIAAFDAAACIARAVDSALAQSAPPAEIIVVDDGSTDGTAELVAGLARAEPRLKLLRQPANRGPAAARNRGIAAAAGDWIAILDADDVFQPERLAYLLAAARRHGLDMAADNLLLYDHAAGRVVGPAIEPARIGERLDLDLHGFVRRCQTNRPGMVDLGLLQPILRRAFLLQHGIAYPEDCRHGEDFVLYLRLLQAGARFALFPAPLYVYTQRYGTISRAVSSLARTAVNYRALEAQTRQLADEPASRADPALHALLLARAEKVRRLRVPVELRALYRARDFSGLAASLLRDAEARRFVSAAVGRKLGRRLVPGRAGRRA